MKTVFHFTPAVGWMNDPNGLIEHNGIHHLFYQHNPRELMIKDMCWGHASSPDLLTWTEHPIALIPGPKGSYDEDGCWSGCAVAGGSGVVVVYSGHKGEIQLPCIARSLDDDLIKWEKSPSNPVISQRPPVEGITDMRDHSVRWDGDRWRQVLAAGAAGEGMLFGYSSPDLCQWSWDGIVLRASEAALPGHVWECPDVFEADGQLVAIISVVTTGRPLVIWVTGAAAGATIRPQRWGIVDYGNRFYAPQSYSDHSGRRIMFGWLRTQADPAAQGQPSAGAMSLPRILSVIDGRLHQAPAPELRRRRSESMRRSMPADTCDLTLPVRTAALEVQVTGRSSLDLQSATAEFYDDNDNRIQLDLSTFFDVRFHGADTGQIGDSPEGATATIIFDSGIVEAFVDGKAAAFSDARLQHVTAVHFRRTAGGPLDITAWALT